jgi:uncharacterized circularly permuted ATP-grasp superfamily protein
MERLFESYQPEAAWDEMFDAAGSARSTALGLHQVLSAMSVAELEERCTESDRAFRDQGITFALSGEERPFPLDPIPRLVAADEWRSVELGVAQRVKVLEHFLDDAYGAGEVFEEGIVPRRIVATSRHFCRNAFDVRSSNGVRIHVAGIDLVKDAAGRFCVLEDNVRIPSGVSYVVENRRAMARMFPELLLSHRVQPVSVYPGRLLAALQASAPRSAGSEPNVVVLTPGVANSAYFEHSFLARQMGVELVEGRDLVCRQDTVYMRTTAGEQRVDVVYRRVDDDFLDPVQFRADSLLGCAGLLNAARAGNVTIANAVGNGIADDKLLYSYVPDLIDYYLGEKPILPNVPTYRLEDPDQLAHVVERIGELVVKPVDASGGQGLVVGPQAGEEELQQTLQAIRSHPRDYIAQEMVNLSTVPTRIGDRLLPRHVDLRPFAINDGERVWVLPGGLTRVALRQGSLVVNSSQGGGSKDTWVLAGAEEPSGEAGEESEVVGGAVLAELPSDWPGQDPGPVFTDLRQAQVQQQQQQQQRRHGAGGRGALRC